MSGTAGGGAGGCSTAGDNSSSGPFERQRRRWLPSCEEPPARFFGGAGSLSCTSGNALLSASANSSARVEPIFGPLRERSGERRPQQLQPGTREVRQAVRDMIAFCRDAPAPQQLVHERRQAEHIRLTTPGATRSPLGRRIRTSDWRGNPDGFERARDANPGHAGLVVGQEDVSRMERAVIDVRDRRQIQRAGQLHGDAERVGRRRRTVFANRQIQRLGSDIVLREIRPRRP